MRKIFQNHASDLFGIRLFLIIIIPREGQNHCRFLSSQWSASQVSLLRATSWQMHRERTLLAGC